jgi:hypothetical protein
MRDCEVDDLTLDFGCRLDRGTQPVEEAEIRAIGIANGADSLASHVKVGRDPAEAVSREEGGDLFVEVIHLEDWPAQDVNGRFEGVPNL